MIRCPMKKSGTGRQAFLFESWHILRVDICLLLDGFIFFDYFPTSTQRIHVWDIYLHFP